MACCSVAATLSTAAAGEAGDDDVEEGHDAVDDGLEDTSDTVNDRHEDGSDGLEETLNLFNS